MASRSIEAIKVAVYLTPALGRLMAPRFRYKVDPAQLASMVNLIDATRGTDAAVVEVGVAQGLSSVFFMEHLRSTGDPRPLILLDTFSGFTSQSIQHEIDVRGKRLRDFAGRFTYTNEAVLTRNLKRAGYDNFRTIKADAATFDWSRLGRIGAVLLDVDLYQPTASALSAIYPLLVQGGGIVVDDCIDGTVDDGASQAYNEFVVKHDLPFERIGRKGGLIRAPKSQLQTVFRAATAHQT